MQEINGFIRYLKEPNSIHPSARVFTKVIHVEVDNEYKDRLVRIYLPSTYDFSNPNKRFPVIYMFDGKNLFDDYTSFVGEWGIDESIEEMISNGETDGIIVVGIDSAPTNIDRSEEMIPEEVAITKKYFKNVKGYASKLGDYIFKELKEEIDSTFYTLSDKKNTGVGGSSMGGLMSYYLYYKYKDYIGYSLSFSPAFFLLTKKSLKENLETYINNPENLGKMFLYVGGVGFESLFTEPTKYAYEHFRNVGFKDDQVHLLIDMSQEHNERAWRIYFKDAIRFFIFLKG